MPKFNLYARPNPNGTDADRRIELGWSPVEAHGSVQLGVTHIVPGAEQFRDREYFGGDEKEPAQRVWDGQFIDLDRDQINQLIHQLRDARDKAYGRDA